MCSVILSHSYFKPLKRALNRSGVTGFRNFNKTHYRPEDTLNIETVCNRVLNPLEVGYLRLSKVVVKNYSNQV